MGRFQLYTKAISHSLGANSEHFKEEAKLYEDKCGGKEGNKDKIRWCIIAGITNGPVDVENWNWVMLKASKVNHYQALEPMCDKIAT